MCLNIYISLNLKKCVENIIYRTNSSTGIWNLLFLVV